MLPIGTGEFILIAFVLVVIFSASRMEALGNALGKFVYSFKKAKAGEGFVDAGSSSTPLRKHERKDRRT